VKRTIISVTFLVVTAVVLLSTSCGTGDKIGSVTMTAAGQTGTIDLKGLGGTLQLQVTANYTSGKQIDETNFATYKIVGVGTEWDGSPVPTPPLGATINNTGLVTAVDPGICTWFSTTGNTTTPGWAFVGWYEITATYRGFTSNTVFIPVASAASGQPNLQGECGP
jgi:hypothetical protein